jgi:hypothetical protein
MRCGGTIETRLPMNQTRKISISSKIFTVKDLQRIAGIFDKQMTLAEKSQHHARVSYSVTFSDDTILESDSPDLFLEESLTLPARPEAVQMAFHNYKLGRDVQFAVRHAIRLMGTSLRPVRLTRNGLVRRSLAYRTQ